MGKDLNDILSDENFEKVGINPNDYETFGDFLNDLKTFSGVLIDPVDESFVI
ncbi:MAG: hypothetical protein LBQ59_04340 [Candidatus Peribacteria bacterium]|jgi:hypothetical protein|nr:hypothetical protein [Candidatus Peribacteria bacterium]